MANRTDRLSLYFLRLLLSTVCALALWVCGVCCPSASFAEEEGATSPAEGQVSATDVPEEKSSSDAHQETPAQVKNVNVSVRFVGTDGVWADSGQLVLEEGSSAWDATRSALISSGMAYRTGTESAQDVIVSITRSDDKTTLEFDAATGSGWHLYLNGERYLGSSSSMELSEGDEIEWRYEVGTFMVSVAVVGPGGTGASYWIAPTSVRMLATQTAWDASLEVFSQNGYGRGRLLSYTTAEDGSVTLESLAALGENGITGEAWQVFVNGVCPDEDAAHIPLHSGDSICWYYAGRGEFELPSFVAKTGAAAQNPADSISIDGVVAQVDKKAASGGASLYTVLDHVSGIALSGEAPAVYLLCEGTRLADPLYLQLEDSAWHASMAYALNGMVNSGEGALSAMGLDKSLYYLNGDKDVVKLGLS